jgi:predicted RNA-binding Zn-ribbon protein involved in translation (DUF1610 family)
MSFRILILENISSLSDYISGVIFYLIFGIYFIGWILTIIDIFEQDEGISWKIFIFIIPFFTVFIYLFVKVIPRIRHSKEYLSKCKNCKQIMFVDENEYLQNKYSCPNCSTENMITTKLKKRNLDY